ncbi:uncharacterized protein EI97DRAFT_443356 [Westerdykella ornata]|uniref:Uncharacterized protein n=1 Tax=Westerdykella ornata TaxID=318751 RepID=A0A6A6JIP0_WESOR|nr:uncharacterized protein EI97DRAFT_443356 [Westerdykella ornata]KAF2275516.1 hypothetical protein EI97DRAFT_443356 [Westerdykella ornata]
MTLISLTPPPSEPPSPCRLSFLDWLNEVDSTYKESNVSQAEHQDVEDASHMGDVQGADTVAMASAAEGPKTDTVVDFEKSRDLGEDVKEVKMFQLGDVQESKSFGMATALQKFQFGTTDVHKPDVMDKSLAEDLREVKSVRMASETEAKAKESSLGGDIRETKVTEREITSALQNPKFLTTSNVESSKAEGTAPAADDLEAKTLGMASALQRLKLDIATEAEESRLLKAKKQKAEKIKIALSDQATRLAMLIPIIHGKPHEHLLGEVSLPKGIPKWGDIYEEWHLADSLKPKRNHVALCKGCCHDCGGCRFERTGYHMSGVCARVDYYCWVVCAEGYEGRELSKEMEEEWFAALLMEKLEIVESETEGSEGSEESGESEEESEEDSEE